MNPAPLLHGAAGNLDEALICGGGLALLLVAYFFAVVREPKPPKTPDKKLEDKHETH
jgi:hypothetical protein